MMKEYIFLTVSVSACLVALVYLLVAVNRFTILREFGF